MKRTHMTFEIRRLKNTLMILENDKQGLLEKFNGLQYDNNAINQLLLEEVLNDIKCLDENLLIGGNKSMN